MSLYLFSFREAIPANYISALPTLFEINNTSRFDVLLMRLITGNINIYSNKLAKTITLNTNYSIFPAQIITRKSTKQLKEFVNPRTLQDFTRYSNKYYGRNIVFYNNLLQELTYYFYYTDQKQYQSAFVNLYRIFEYVSYTFPLMHASNFGNYIGTFETFKKYFADIDSELSFFDKFTNNIYSGTPYLTLRSDFDFSCSDINIANNCYDSLRKMIDPADWILSDRPNHTLGLENKNLLKLFRNTRNRYFHFAIGKGQKNIRTTDLKDPDFFFEKINPIFLNWISFIYATVARESLDNSLI